MRRTQENTHAHVGHWRECVSLIHAAAMGVARLLQMRRQPEEFSFHAEKSTQHPGEEIRIDGREEAVRNRV
jgi:hypothetical protein